jgi:hypothetical protein
MRETMFDSALSIAWESLYVHACRIARLGIMRPASYYKLSADQNHPGSALHCALCLCYDVMGYYEKAVSMPRWSCPRARNRATLALSQFPEF